MNKKKKLIKIIEKSNKEAQILHKLDRKSKKYKKIYDRYIEKLCNKILKLFNYV